MLEAGCWPSHRGFAAANDAGLAWLVPDVPAKSCLALSRSSAAAAPQATGVEGLGCGHALFGPGGRPDSGEGRAGLRGRLARTCSMPYRRHGPRHWCCPAWSGFLLVRAWAARPGLHQDAAADHSRPGHRAAPRLLGVANPLCCLACSAAVLQGQPIDGLACCCWEACMPAVVHRRFRYAGTSPVGVQACMPTGNVLTSLQRLWTRLGFLALRE